MFFYNNQNVVHTILVRSYLLNKSRHLLVFVQINNAIFKGKFIDLVIVCFDYLKVDAGYVPGALFNRAFYKPIFKLSRHRRFIF